MLTEKTLPLLKTSRQYFNKTFVSNKANPFRLSSLDFYQSKDEEVNSEGPRTPTKKKVNSNLRVCIVSDYPIIKDLAVNKLNFDLTDKFERDNLDWDLGWFDGPSNCIKYLGQLSSH